MTNALSACFVGLGSIGKRHLGNLNAVAAARGLKISVDALRHKGAAPLDASTAELIRNEYVQSEDLGHYDLMFICNPSQLHYKTLCDLSDKAEHFFVEKPVFVKPLSEESLVPFDDPKKYYVACPMRHTKVFDFLQQFVRKHQIFSARAICSSYLPEWRPNQDYRMLYSAAKESGGVKLDLIHEFDYLFTLFGFPVRSFLIEGKFSNLEIESSDTVAYIGEYADKVVELHLDYHGRKIQRAIELYTAEDVVACDFVKSEVQYRKSGEVVSLAEERNDYCRRELDCFLDFALEGGRNVNSLRHANKVLSLLFKESPT